MLSPNTWRTLCSHRASVSPNWLLTNRKAGQTTVRFSVNTKSMNDVSYAKKDTWRNSMIHKALGKQNNTIFSTGVVSRRNYCTSQNKLNCWKCKQPLENDPAFFCLACQVVQPPGEGTSYFKIMDWWVPRHSLFSYPWIIFLISQSLISQYRLFPVMLCSVWMHKSSREDMCSSSVRSIQTTSARNLW